MAAIITSASGQFANLVEQNKVGVVTLAFEDAITKSFISHPMRNMTRSEVKRRFDMCAVIFSKLRGDKKWGLQRALDYVVIYLRNELDGVSWEEGAAKQQRSVWAPGDD